MKRRPPRDEFICPHCGARVPAGAISCRECGSDDETGWAENAGEWEANASAGYGSDDDFDYDEYLAREFPDQAPPFSRHDARRRLWRVIVIAVVAAFLFWGLAGL